MKRLLLVLSLGFLFSCSGEKKMKVKDCEILSYGTFDVYQKDQKVGTIYRKDSLQIETYVGKKITGLTRVKKISPCQYQMKSFWEKQKIDTLNFTINYTMTETNRIIYEMSPTYLKTESKLLGSIEKISDSIPQNILVKFGN